MSATACAALQHSPHPPGPPGRDFEAYYSAGATWNAGGNPWSRDIWRTERTLPGVDASREELLPYAGPAAALPLWGAFAHLPIDAARALWFASLLLAFGVLVVCALVLAGVRITLLDTILALLFGAVTAPVVSDIALAQAALVSAAGTAFALLALRRRSVWTIAGALVAALQPNLALPLLARCTDRRALALLAAAGALFLAIAFAAGGGPGGFIAYLHVLAEHGKSERFTAIQYGVPAILAAFGIAPGVALVFANVAAAGSVGAVVYAACRFHRRPLIAAYVAIALLPFAVPFFHEHDFVVMLVPALVSATAGDVRARTLAGIASVCIFVDWFGFAQRPFAAASIACLGLALACAYPALTRRPAKSTLASVPVAVCIVLLGALVPLALAHPAPMWPYQLGDFHAAAGLSASAVWAAEQQRNGLDAIVPAWGVLRAVPLLGCVLLAAASALGYGTRGPATRTRPAAIASGTAVSESPAHGPSTQ